MKAISKTSFLLLLVVSTIWLAGCKKADTNNGSINGTWNYTGLFATNADTFVQAIPSPISGASLTLSANGQFSYSSEHVHWDPFTILDSTINVTGTFYYSQDTLIFYDNLQPTVPIINKVAIFNNHSLILLQKNSFIGTQIQFYFSR